MALFQFIYVAFPENIVRYVVVVYFDSIQKIRFVEVLFVFLYLEYKYDYRKNVEILWKYTLHIVNFAQACTSQSHTIHMGYGHNKLCRY